MVKVKVAKAKLENRVLQFVAHRTEEGNGFTAIYQAVIVVQSCVPDELRAKENSEGS